MNEAYTPTFHRGVRTRFDPIRQAWILLAPERVWFLDDISRAVLDLVDGHRTLGDITDRLANDFDAPREEILTDVIELFDTFVDRGVLAI